MKLCDFGFARCLPKERRMYDLTDYVATRWYRSPELLLGDTKYGIEVDYWAIGCIMGELCDGQPLFPGDSEIDMLYLIQKVMGELTPEQNEMFSKNPRFLGLKFPDVSKPETLEKKYIGKMSKKALSFMNGLLHMNPSERLKGIKALTHPYFDEIRFKDDEFYKITEGEDLEDISNREATRPIQSSQGPADKITGPTFEERHKNLHSRAGVTAYSGFDNSTIKDMPPKRKSKKINKTKKMDLIYGKKTLYDFKNVSVTQFNDKAHSFGKHKYSNGTIRNKDVLNIYGNGDMANTQYTSRNDEANISNTFLKGNKKGALYKGISNSKSTVGGAFPTQLTHHKLIDSHEYNYDISTPISGSVMRSSPFQAELLGNTQNHQSRESLHNNIIVEDDKEINYSTSNHSTHRKSNRSRDRSDLHERLNTDTTQILNERNKDKSFSKDLIMQMKEKIRRKQRNNNEMSKILVLGTSNMEENYKNTEYHDFGVTYHNLSSFNNTKQSKKVNSLGRSPNKKKHKIAKKVSIFKVSYVGSIQTEYPKTFTLQQKYVRP